MQRVKITTLYFSSSFKSYCSLYQKDLILVAAEVGMNERRGFDERVP